METGPITQINITSATTPEDITIIHHLFTEYAHALGIDLTFQSFEKELASLPGSYLRLLIARDALDGTVLGCVGVRPLPSAPKEYCEMKRLYVQPIGRKKGVGRALVEAAISVGKDSGYSEMKLDTLVNMVQARKLYEQVGFAECEPYYDTPLISNTVFLSRKL